MKLPNPPDCILAKSLQAQNLAGVVLEPCATCLAPGYGGSKMEAEEGTKAAKSRIVGSPPEKQEASPEAQHAALQSVGDVQRLSCCSV